MRYGRFDTFSRMLDRQRVDVDSRIVRAGERGRSSVPFSLEPTGILAAIAEAGRALRKAPGVPLANRPVTLERHEARDVSLGMLCQIINTSVEPDTATLPAFTSNSMQNRDTCNLTERLLQVTVDQLRRAQLPDGEPNRPGCQAVYSGNRLLFLREALGERISLAMVSFSVNGVTFPAGSFARLDFTDEPIVTTDGYGKPAMPAKGLDVVSLERVEQAAFVRLSAFALPPEQRAAFAASPEAAEGWGFLMPRILQEQLGSIATVVDASVAT